MISQIAYCAALCESKNRKHEKNWQGGPTFNSRIRIIFETITNSLDKQLAHSRSIKIHLKSVFSSA